MPPLARKGGTPGLSPRQSVRRGLRIDENIAPISFQFKPSLGISAREIDRLGLDIRSFREPLKRVIQRVMAPSFRENFEEEGRPDEWADLSDATLQIREKMGFSGDRILDRTGLLKKTVQQLNIWTINETSATIRDLPSKVWYGKIHQAGFAGKGGSSLWKSGGGKVSARTKAFGGDAKAAMQDLNDEINVALRNGTKRGRKAAGDRFVAEIPQRQFVLIQEDDFDAVEEIFVEWLQERMAAHGFRRGLG